MAVTSVRTSRARDDDEGCSIDRLPASSVAGRLRSSLAETARLLADFEREQEQSEVPDLNTYQKCCKQLVTFMATHMDTSRNFVQQMERIIQASYTQSSGFTLGSTCTEALWLRYDGSQRTELTAQNLDVPRTPSTRASTIKADTGANIAINVAPLGVANASVTGSRPTCSPHVGLPVFTPPTVGRESKRQSETDRSVPRQESKRARHTVARNLYGAGRLDCGDEEDSELESTKESETETEAESTGPGESNEDSRSHQHMMKSLMLESASSEQIVWPCASANPLDRNPAFMERLKTAVKLVDAENCCPPPGMKCTRGCTSVRTWMCQSHRTQGGNASVCHDKVCCVWLYVDTHLVRCQNTGCEFKNRVGLRQAKHDIFLSKQKLKVVSDKLLTAKAMIGDSAGDQSRTSTSQIESKIEKLEEKCAKLEDTILLHKDRQRAFLFDLNALDTSRADCEPDDVPSFQSHYVKMGPREQDQSLR